MNFFAFIFWTLVLVAIFAMPYELHQIGEAIAQCQEMHK